MTLQVGAEGGLDQDGDAPADQGRCATGRRDDGAHRAAASPGDSGAQIRTWRNASWSTLTNGVRVMSGSAAPGGVLTLGHPADRDVGRELLEIAARWSPRPGPCQLRRRLAGRVHRDPQGLVPADALGGADVEPGPSRTPTAKVGSVSSTTVAVVALTAADAADQAAGGHHRLADGDPAGGALVDGHGVLEVGEPVVDDGRRRRWGWSRRTAGARWRTAAGQPTARRPPGSTAAAGRRPGPAAAGSRGAATRS